MKLFAVELSYADVLVDLILSLIPSSRWDASLLFLLFANVS